MDRTRREVLAGAAALAAAAAVPLPAVHEELEESYLDWLTLSSSDYYTATRLPWTVPVVGELTAEEAEQARGSSTSRTGRARRSAIARRDRSHGCLPRVLAALSDTITAGLVG
jgi:hypothetical protein